MAEYIHYKDDWDRMIENRDIENYKMSQARKEGERIAKIQVAKKMKIDRPIADVVRLTGLSVEEIEEL